MKIGEYELNKQEEKFVLDVFSLLKTEFPAAELVDRTEYLGIGEPDKHLMCYFSAKRGKLFFKFKNRQKTEFFDGIDVQKEIEGTIALFKSQDFFLKSSKNGATSLENSCATSSKSCLSQNEDDLENFLCKKYDFLMSSIGPENFSINFDNCSAHLKNVLYRNGIRSIGELKSRDKIALLQTKGFGIKSLFELVDFLSQIHAEEIGEDSTSFEEARKIELSLNDIKKKMGIVETFEKTPIVIDFDNASEMSEKNKKDFEVLYDELLDLISAKASAQLSEKEFLIFSARLGLRQPVKTLQEIADMFGVTRERIRQIFVKSIKKFEKKKIFLLKSLDFEVKLCETIEKIDGISAAGFVAFLVLEKHNDNLTNFIVEHIFKCDLPPAHIKALLSDQKPDPKN